jgi:hypothetical protein
VVRMTDQPDLNIGKEWSKNDLFSFATGLRLKRAAAAKAGIYGNDAAEATYPITREDVDGQSLDDSKSNYTLTFAKGEYPPVNAFWSVTMYDGKTRLLTGA